MTYVGNFIDVKFTHLFYEKTILLCIVFTKAKLNIIEFQLEKLPVR